jgi:hypothetical protein
MVEAMGRRVRTAADLRTAIEAPLLGEMPPIVWKRPPRPKVERARKVARTRALKPPREPKVVGSKPKLGQA